MGDIANDIIEGFFCSNCGEVVDGESPGYPRECNGCSKSSSNDKKKEERDRKLSSFKYDLEVIDKEYYKVQKLTEFHYRITPREKILKGLILDIYPVNSKYHFMIRTNVLKKDERGFFKSPSDLLKKIFGLEGKQ